MHRALFSTVMILLINSPALAVVKYPYIIYATNRMIALNSQGGSQNPQAAAEILLDACYASRQLLDDKSFREDLDQILKSRDKHLPELKELKNNLQQFALAFLSTEEEAFKNAGLSEEAIKRIMVGASLFRNRVDQQLNPDTVLDGIKQFNKEVCDKTSLESVKEEGRRRELIEKWKYKIGGIVVIVIDIPLNGLFPGFAYGSMAIGAGMMSWSGD